MSNITRYNVSYALNQPLNLEQPLPVVAKRDPTTSDKFPIGQEWINTSTNTVFFLTSIANNAANWVSVSGGAGVFSSLTVNPGPTNLSTVGNGAVSIGNATNTGAVTITAGTGNVSIVGGGHTISIGNDAAANTVNIGSNTGAAATTINSGTGAITLSPAVTGTIVIGTATQTGSITLGLSTGAQTVNIATGAGTPTVNIGTNAGAVVGIAIGNNTAGSALALEASATGGMSLSSGGNVIMLPNVATPVASPTATVVSNNRVGYATFTGFTTAAAGTQAFTVTNSVVTAASAIFVDVMNTGTNAALLTKTGVVPAAGSFVVTVTNNGSQALNGSAILTWWVIN